MVSTQFLHVIRTTHANSSALMVYQRSGRSGDCAHVYAHVRVRANLSVHAYMYMYVSMPASITWFGSYVAGEQPPDVCGLDLCIHS